MVITTPTRGITKRDFAKSHNCNYKLRLGDRAGGPHGRGGRGGPARDRPAARARGQVAAKASKAGPGTDQAVE